jgi:predicted nucleic acid-binding protein
MTKKIVLDASVALAWLYERQKSEERDCAERVLLEFAKTEIWVPSLWFTETANALLLGERRNVVTQAQVAHYLNKLSALPVNVDEASLKDHHNRILACARQYKLTAYDAVYLDLALRTDAVLATFDNALAKAMHAAGGEVFE